MVTVSSGHCIDAEQEHTRADVAHELLAKRSNAIGQTFFASLRLTPSFSTCLARFHSLLRAAQLRDDSDCRGLNSLRREMIGDGDERDVEIERSPTGRRVAIS